MRRRVVLAAAIAAALTVPLLTPASAGAGRNSIVTIGVIAPIDGGLTSFGKGIRNSVQLAVDQANGDKAIPGWRVTVRALDDSSQPAKGAAAAKILARDASVTAIVGPYNSGVAEAVLPALRGRVAVLSPSNTLTSLTQGASPGSPKRPYENYFRMVGPDSLQAEYLAQRARALGYSKAAVVSETKAVSKDLADRFAASFRQGGGTVAAQQAVPDGATDFSTFLMAATPTSPDLIFFGGEYGVAAKLRTAATGAGLAVPMMGGDGMNDPTFIADAGTAAVGSYASGVGAPIVSQPGGTAFASEYRAAGFGDAPTDYGPYAYDATNAIIRTLAKQLKGKSSIPSNTRSKVVSGLQKTDMRGVTGAVAFDEYGDETDPTFTLYRVTGSPPAWTPVN
jgi:branched-chain amino acid transport system substrate-binding protein